jgi:hypothetical protein
MTSNVQQTHLAAQRSRACLHLLCHPAVQLCLLLFPLTVQHTNLIAQQTRACSSTSLATLLYSSALSSSSLQYSTLTLLHSRREHAHPPPWPPCCTALPSPLPPYSTAHSPYCTADESMLLHLLGHPVVQLYPLILLLTENQSVNHLIPQQYSNFRIKGKYL